jgi:guanyl-specific ribonuclease Sa
MAQTVGFGKQKREMLSNSRLAPDVRVALIDFKTQIKSGADLVVFENSEGGLDRLAAGEAYYEFDVGQAHAGDAEPRGKRRLVALVKPGRIIETMYFSDDHYKLGAWRELQYP